MEPKLRVLKIREVHLPERSNEGDAGLDFFMPEDLSLWDLSEANSKAQGMKLVNRGFVGAGEYSVSLDDQGLIQEIYLGPNSRISIPSGLKILLEPVDSAMIAANKSGRSTRQGLIFTAQVCDSPYTGEYHIGIYNTNLEVIALKRGEALAQFIHTPIYLTEPQEITREEFDKDAQNWGTRGDNGMGSGDNKAKH